MNSEPVSSSRPQVNVAEVDGPLLFSVELQRLMVRFEQQPVEIRDLLDATKGRGYNLLLLVIALPFVTPLPLPGFSIPFGFVVSLLGARLALGREPWLPRCVLRRQLPCRFFSRLMRSATEVMRGIEVFLRPRFGFVEKHVIFSRIGGALTAFSGILLMLPLPLPFSNSLPAWTVILFSAGDLGRDGIFYFAGCAAFALSLAYFALVAFGGWEVSEKIWAWCLMALP